MMGLLAGLSRRTAAQSTQKSANLSGGLSRKGRGDESPLRGALNEPRPELEGKPQPATGLAGPGTEKSTSESEGGPCDCPGQRSADGKRCGARSAASRPRGRAPKCGGSGVAGQALQSALGAVTGSQTPSQAVGDFADILSNELLGVPIVEGGAEIIAGDRTIGSTILDAIGGTYQATLGQVEDAVEGSIERAFQVERETGSTLQGISSIVDDVISSSAFGPLYDALNSND